MRISDWSSDVCSSDLFNRTRDLLPVFLAEPGEVNGGAACLGSRGLRQPALVEIVRLIEDEIASVQGRIVITECRLPEGLVDRLQPREASEPLPADLRLPRRHCSVAGLRSEERRVGKEGDR